MCRLKVKHLVALAAAVALLSAGLYAYGGQALLLLLRHTAAARMASDTVAGFGPDSLTAVLCGAGSPFPDDRRSGPCTLVVAGTRMFIFDSGAGSPKTLQQMGFNLGGVEAIYLTHFHSDHIDGLGQLLLQRWVTGPNTVPVPVHGPRGVEAVVRGFVAAYAADQTYRTAHHGDATVPASGFGATAMPFDLDANTRCVFRGILASLSSVHIANVPVLFIFAMH
jgi:ribonuclease Z